MRKLQLRKETLQILTDSQARQIAGGSEWTDNCSTGACTSDNCGSYAGCQTDVDHTCPSCRCTEGCTTGCVTNNGTLCNLTIGC